MQNNIQTMKKLKSRIQYLIYRILRALKHDTESAINELHRYINTQHFTYGVGYKNTGDFATCKLSLARYNVQDAAILGLMHIFCKSIMKA